MKMSLYIISLISKKRPRKGQKINTDVSDVIWKFYSIEKYIFLDTFSI